MDRMRLSEFIARALSDVVAGVALAQQQSAPSGAVINPPNVNWSDTKKGYFLRPGSGPDSAPLLTPVDFDILLTIADDDKAQGGIGVFAASIGIGVKGETQTRLEAANRVAFQVLVKLPDPG